MDGLQPSSRSQYSSHYGSQYGAASGGVDSSGRGRLPPPPPPPPLSQRGSSGTMTRAERFEDEKRRVVSSCFSKEDTNGTLEEAYITHIRVTEDAAYPQSPPPPNSSNENKKARVIIIAVRNTGRVRIHKARENSTSSFSIGKTWNMEDVTVIQSFFFAPTGGTEEQQRRDWAGDSGFVVTIGKPYYWQAGTAKEKDFFIASLVKIYRKYTQGKVPQLVGFKAEEVDQLLAAPGSQLRRADTGATTASSQSVNRGPTHVRGQSQPGNLSDGSSPDRFSQKYRRSPSTTLDNRQPLPTESLDRSLPALPYAVNPFTKSQQQRSQDVSRNGTPEPGTRTVSTDASIISAPKSTLEMLTTKASQAGFGSPRPRTPGESSVTDYKRLERSSPGRGVDSRLDTESSMDAYSLGGASSDRVYANGTATVSSTAVDRRDPSPRSFRPGTAQSNNSSLLSKNEDVSSDKSRPTLQDRKRPPLYGQGGYVQSDSKGAAAKEPDGDILSPVSDRKPSDQSVISPSDASSPAALAGEGHRPGLGPMMKKKSRNDVAATFRKAATALNAFRPRAGGAADKFMANGRKQSGEPDGITGVVVAPGRARLMSDDSTKSSEDQSSAGRFSSIDSSSRKDAENELPSKSAVEKAAKRQKRRTPGQEKNIAALGIDPLLLEGRGLEFETILDELGWNTTSPHRKTVDTLEAGLKRELGRVEAGSWLGHLEQRDDRVEAVDRLLEQAIKECEELEGLLTLYGVELATLNDDVAYIEAQSHGLQVQTANQKILRSELNSLLDTVTLDPRSLQSLRRAQIASDEGLEAVEASLLQVYRALINIDPSLRRRAKDVSGDDPKAITKEETPATNYSSMAAVREKKEIYMNEINGFLEMLQQYLDGAFSNAFSQTRSDLQQRKRQASSYGSVKLYAEAHDLGRSFLWKYNALVLFAKEMNFSAWEELIRLYRSRAQSLYYEEMRDQPSSSKEMARQPTGEERDILFTGQEKDSDERGTTSRKLTIKRSQLLARSIKSGSGEKAAAATAASTAGRIGKMLPFEAFAMALEESIRLISLEQNFIVDFFHATSMLNLDFNDIVAAGPAPSNRTGGDLSAYKPFETDRAIANYVAGVMDEIFGFWRTEMQGLIDWAVFCEPLQVIGIMTAIERQLLELEDHYQDFLCRTLQTMLERLVVQFSRFLDEQVHAIEDTKVKIKRRKGVVSFFNTFPNFAAAVESKLPPEEEEGEEQLHNSRAGNDDGAEGRPAGANTVRGRLQVRARVNDGYQRINRAMFESVKVIAKDSPAVSAGQGGILSQGALAAIAASTGGDSDEKEVLNYHILLIENMNHYVEEVDEGGSTVLRQWKGKANVELDEHLDQYLRLVIRRPMGKLLDFIESTESLLASGTPADALATRSSHSRPVFKKLVAAHDGRELRRGIDTLKKRVEKHFGDADGPTLSRALVMKVVRRCELSYLSVYERTKRIADQVYEGAVELDWRADDVVAAFRR